MREGEDYSEGDYPLAPPEAHNYLAEASRLDVQGYRSRIFQATVTALDGANQVFIRRDGQSAADPVSYPSNDDVTFGIGNRVLVIDGNGRGGWIVALRIAKN